MDTIELLKRNAHVDTLHVNDLIEYMEHIPPEDQEQVLVSLAAWQFSRYQWRYTIPEKKSHNALLIFLFLSIWAIVTLGFAL